MVGSKQFRRQGIIILGAVFFTMLLWKGLSHSDQPMKRPLPSVARGTFLTQVPNSHQVPQPNHRLTSGTFTSDKPLFDQLVDAGLSAQRVDRMIKALSPDVDFRRVRSGVHWALSFLDDVPIQFTLKLSETEIYDVFQLYLNPQVVKRIVPVSVETQYFQGEIVSSLFEAFSGMPKGMSLAVQVSEVFAWDIDFYMDPRVGDTFEFLVESAFVDRDGKKEFLEYRRILAGKYIGRKGEYEAFLYEDEKGEDAYYNRKGESLVRDVLRSPLKLVRITSRFKGQRFHPVLKKRRAHNGVDYGAPKNTPVMAVSDGKVIHAGWYGQAGKAVVIAHKGKMITQYFHLNSIPKTIKKGTRVRQGRVIGFVGKTGLATGYHLHFGMKINGRYVDPQRQKFQPGLPIAKSKMAGFKERVAFYERTYASFAAPIQMARMTSAP